MGAGGKKHLRIAVGGTKTSAFLNEQIAKGATGNQTTQPSQLRTMPKCHM